MHRVHVLSRGALSVALAICVLWASGGAARAQIGSDRYAAIVMDARSGAVLIASDPDELRHPASLAKMMTLYLAFEALRDGRLGLNSPILVSDEAAAKPPSRLGLAPGSTLTVEEAILAIVTKSANDAAAALGEAIGGGSEDAFAQLMTTRARAIGMTRTTFRNASGLPDYEQVSTARDMATLGRRLMIDFPGQYGYFSTPSFYFRGRTHVNHNHLLEMYEGADGIKTGYVNDSGFNLVGSATRDGVRLVATVFGGGSARERDRHMMEILDQGFDRMGVAPRAGVPMASQGLPYLVASAQAARLTAGREGMQLMAAAAAPLRARVSRYEEPAYVPSRAPVPFATTPFAMTRGEMLAARRGVFPAAQHGAPGRVPTRFAALATRVERGDTERTLPGRVATRSFPVLLASAPHPLRLPSVLPARPMAHVLALPMPPPRAPAGRGASAHGGAPVAAMPARHPVRRG